MVAKAREVGAREMVRSRVRATAMMVAKARAIVGATVMVRARVRVKILSDGDK